jgi:hypothetical protein
MHLAHTEAKGPCYARALAQQLWKGEEKFLQIDSHMRFVPEWDSTLEAMLSACDSKKPILSTYPTGYERGKAMPTDK